MSNGNPKTIFLEGLHESTVYDTDEDNDSIAALKGSITSYGSGGTEHCLWEIGFSACETYI
jgi:hypothetical protein